MAPKQAPMPTADHYTGEVRFGCERHPDAIVCVVLVPIDSSHGEQLHIAGDAEATPHLTG